MERLGPACRVASIWGGNGIGKSSTLANILIELSLPREDQCTNPFFARCKFFSDRRKWANFYGPNRNHAWAVIMQRDVANEVLAPEIKRWAPVGSYESSIGDKHFVNWYEFRNGGTIKVYTPKQDIGQFKGPNYDGVWADEPFPLQWYDEGLKRSRGKGFYFSIMTPLWDSNAGIFCNEVLQMPEEERILHKIGIYSACRDRGVRGFREPETIDAEIRSTPPANRRARLYGEPMFLSGKVLTSFDAKINLIDRATAIDWIRRNGCTWYVTIDPHPKLPHLVQILAKLPSDDPDDTAHKKGRVIFVDEFPRWEVGSFLDMEEIPENTIEYYLSPRPEPFHKMLEFGGKNPDKFVRVMKYMEAEVIRRYAGKLDGRGKAEFPMVGNKVRRRYVDPRASAMKSSSGDLKLDEVWRRHGYTVWPSKGKGIDLKAGHELINQMFSGKLGDDGSIVEAPSLFIVEDDCPITANHVFNHHNVANVDEESGEFTGDVKEKYNEAYKHGVDGMRYAITMELPYEESEWMKEESTEPKKRKKLFECM